MTDEFPAIVTANDDPKKAGRIKVKCEAILSGGAELPDWIEPAFPLSDGSAGWFGVPTVGSKITLVKRVGAAPRTLACIVSSRTLQWRPAFNGGLPSRFKDDYPDAWGFYASGVLFVVNRKTGEISLSNPSGAKLTLTAGGDIVIEMASTIRLGGEALLAALDGVVTKQCVCSFAGLHPDASSSVMAKK